MCFMMVKRMDDFIHLSTGHAALCGMQLEPHDEVSVKLGLSLSSLTTKHHIARHLKMNRKKAYYKTLKEKGRRLVAKMSCFYKMGLDNAKTSHRSGKVPLHEDAKSMSGGGGVAGGNVA